MSKLKLFLFFKRKIRKKYFLKNKSFKMKICLYYSIYMPKMRLTLCQIVKVFFSSLYEAFNPLSLTRAEFKQKMRRMENDLEDIRSTANRLESLIERLQAEGNTIPPNITFAELDTTPLDPPSEPEELD